MKIEVDYQVEWPDPDELGGTVEQDGTEQITPPDDFLDWDGSDQEQWVYDVMDHRMSDGMPDEASGLWLDWRLVA